MLVSLAKRLLDRPDLLAALRQSWAAFRRQRVGHDFLERLLARGDDRLLEDVGLERPQGHHLIGETLFAPHRGFDRWQL